MKLPDKSIKILFNRILGPLLFIWITWSIYKQIIRQPNLDESFGYIKEAINGKFAFQFLLIVVLMCCNWTVEARKWQVLMKPLQQISLWRSLKAVLTGLAFGLNTPNRVGEYGGRMMYVKEGLRISSVALTIIGSLSQLIVTLILGGAGLLIQHYRLAEISVDIELMPLWLQITEGIVFVMAAVLLLFYFRLDWMVRGLKLLKLRNKWLQYFEVLKNIHVTILLRVLSLSACRYLLFVYAYILLLEIMHVDIYAHDAFWLISILYLILALVPTIALLEVGLRGKAAIMLFQLSSTNVLGIYAASTGIWLINLVVPALAGSALVLGLKIFNTKR